MVVDTHDGRTLEIRVLIPDVAGIAPAGVKSDIFHALHSQHFFPVALGKDRDAGRDAGIIVKFIFRIGPAEFYVYRIISCSQKVLLQLLISSLNRGRNGDDGCDTNDDTEHRQKRTHLVGPDSLKG